MVVSARVAGTDVEFRLKKLLISAGRIPDTDDIGPELAGVEADNYGFVGVNEPL